MNNIYDKNWKIVTKWIKLGREIFGSTYTHGEGNLKRQIHMKKISLFSKFNKKC